MIQEADTLTTVMLLNKQKTQNGAGRVLDDNVSWGTQSASHEKTLEREIADSLSISGSDDAVTSFCDYHMSSCSCDLQANFISRFQSECIAVLCKPRQINMILLVEKFGEKE
ncbi:hypothetical protein SELMODRAFT_423226 [Selaginella moellendorffii]|uniref:Uncharacterized protein n=1 Tax=Selaginella moellendorffii TaxID=88036 RepID=D8SKZ6_SELML|nr:hypothetical protein SELMODRAFT_423226 [Selaginella moellendorffii]